VVAILEVVLSSLATAFRTLAPWSAAADDLSSAEWDRYVAVAGEVERADPAEVDNALDELLGDGSGFEAEDDETRLFLLLRVVFDLPETARESERRSFKGWVNWPPPDANGNVSLSWPITWEAGRPALVSPYEGSEGRPYAAVAEYRHFLASYPFRALSR
jgi:hypothetical protein